MRVIRNQIQVSEISLSVVVTSVVKKQHILHTAATLAQLLEHRTASRESRVQSRDKTNSQALKITGKIILVVC